MSPGERPRAVLLALLVGGLGSLLASILFDRALGQLGFPGEVPVAAPPNYVHRVDNVEFQYELRANDRGIRYRTIPPAKPPGTKRVIVLGDSMTEGTGVDDRDRWSDRLERSFRERGVPVEFVNAAEAGRSVFNYGQKLFHIGFDYEPDGVVVGFFFNDVSAASADEEPDHMFPGALGRRTTPLRSLSYRLWPHLYVQLRGTLLAEERGEAKGDLVAAARAEAERRGIPDEVFDAWRDALPPDLVKVADSRRINPGVLTYALTRPGYFHEAFDLSSPRAQRRLANLMAMIETMRSACAERGIPLALVLLPSVHQYDPDSLERVQAKMFAAVGHPLRPEWITGTTRLQTALASWAREEGLPYLDLTPTFRAAVRYARQPLNYRIDPHWTPAGHAVAADAIRVWLPYQPGFGFLEAPRGEVASH